MSAAADKKRGKARPSAGRVEPSAPATFSLTAHALSYALAIFLGSTLLFLLEPIAAKRLVPLLGGSAAVWTACLVFFQTALLLGYCVAHLLVTRTKPRTQVTAYIGLLALSGVQLVLAVDPTLRANADRPIASVLWLLCRLIGLPFVTLSAASPLLQAWFARTSPRGGTNAYRLFAISNIGSIVALLAYSWLIEPRLTLRAQTILVAVVLAMLAMLAGIIGASVRNAEVDVDATTPAESAGVPPATAPGGIVAFHLSNRFLALAPVVQQLASNAGMEAVRVVDREDHSRQVFDSEWVLATSNPEFLANPAVVHARWPIEVPVGLRLWTDDYSSLFPVIKVSQRGL